MSGIVTLEDLLEELVGNIFSEHSRQTSQLFTIEPDGSILVSGAVPVREINRELGLDLPDSGDFTTIAGLSLALAGRIPSPGEKLSIENGTVIEIVDASPRRVRTVRIRPHREAPESSPEP
jgi:putative hemolysin